MGLDNGLILKTKNKIENFPWYVNCKYESWLDKNKDYHELEVLYYRKCWGIRGEINALLHLWNNEECIKNVDPEDIPAIIRILEKYLDKEYYENNADSIWEYDEMINHLIQDIKNLCWFKEWLENNQDDVIECYWYDSY